MKTIGFVGLGLMGSAMTANLISAGWPVIGHDLDPDKIAAFVEAGGQRAEDPARVADKTDVIILSLPNSQVVDDVAVNSLKLFDTNRRNLILIDTTTADPVMSETLAGRLRKKGIGMLDATISGTSKMCADRDITFMVGGDENVFKTCEPILFILHP